MTPRNDQNGQLGDLERPVADQRGIESDEGVDKLGFSFWHLRHRSLSGWLRSAIPVIWSFMQFVLGFFFSCQRGFISANILRQQFLWTSASRRQCCFCKNDLQACPPTSMSVVLFLEAVWKCQTPSLSTPRTASLRLFFHLFNLVLQLVPAFTLRCIPVWLFCTYSVCFYYSSFLHKKIS